MNVADSLNNTISDWFESIVYPSHPKGLYEPIEYTLRSGGKRLRPTLLLAAYKGYKDDVSNVRSQCIGIEMFHNFTLLHDDLMDKSEVRRGLPTVHKCWNANTAILSGDTMLTMATQLISDCADSHLRAVLNLFNATAIEIYEGQQLDMDFETRRDVTVDEYMKMIRLKTSVLLGCSLKTGAIIADAPDADADALYRFGLLLGIGFQLRDDYLDTFGDPLLFGKQIGGDILNDKKTWLMITACEEDNSGVMKKIAENRLEGEEKINAVRDVYLDLNLDKRIVEIIRKYSNEAVSSIADISMNHEIKTYLVELAESLTQRIN